MLLLLLLYCSKEHINLSDGQREEFSVKSSITDGLSVSPIHLATYLGKYVRKKDGQLNLVIVQRSPNSRTLQSDGKVYPNVSNILGPLMCAHTKQNHAGFCGLGTQLSTPVSREGYSLDQTLLPPLPNIFRA